MADVVELITTDHREVERLFDLIKQDPEQRENLVPQLCTLLSAHSHAEQVEVYPVAADDLGESDQIRKAEEEHNEVEELVAQVEAQDDVSSEVTTRLLDELERSVRAHNQEEETTILAKMTQDLDTDRRRELGVAFAEAKKSQMG